MSNPISRAERLIILVVVLLFAGVQVRLADRTGVTVDEPSHLLSAYLYWQGQDQLQPGDMPPLIKLAGGWVPHLVGLRLPPAEDPSWKSQHEWIISQAMMANLTAAEKDRVFFWSRLPLILFPVAGCLLLWWWGRQLFGPTSGVLVAIVFCLAPTALGHGHLFKNDWAAAFTYLLFWYRCWVYWGKPNAVNGSGVAIAAGLALCAKLSLIFLAPVAVVVIVAGQLWFRKSWREVCLTTGLAVLLLYAIPLAAWQFDHSGLDQARLRAISVDPSTPPIAAWFGRTFAHWPFPSRLWQGTLALVQSNAGGNGVYLHGQVYPSGHPLYFLTALAVKLPVPQQMLILAGFVTTLLLWRRAGARVLFWLAPPLLYLLLASLSSLQLGIRLVLPSLIFFTLWTGAFFRWSLQRQRQLPRLLAATLLLGLGWSSAATYPHYLSFFNAWVGGPENGLAWLSDSNLDWGQNLPEFADWVETHQIRRIRLAYFGMDNPWAYLRDDRLTSIPPPWSDALAQGIRYVPQPGYYAISASLLSGHHFAPKYRDYFAAFREAKPIARAGYSIQIYEVR